MFQYLITSQTEMKLSNHLFVCSLMPFILTDIGNGIETWVDQSLPVLLMPQRCSITTNNCPIGSQCRGGICFWTHCLADGMTGLYMNGKQNTEEESLSKEQHYSTELTNQDMTCSRDWQDLSDALSHCYIMAGTTDSRANAENICKMLDPKGSLFSFAGEGYGSIPLALTDKQSVKTWTDAHFKDGLWFWGNDPNNLVPTKMIVEGPKGDCLYLEVKNSNESLGENTLLEKLVPTSCLKSKETFEVVCYTPKNSDFLATSPSPKGYEYSEETYPTESDISTLPPLQTITSSSTTNIKKYETLKCKTGWIEVHKNLDLCFFRGIPTKSKDEATKQCQSKDPNSTLIIFSDVESNSIPLFLNGGNPIKLWTEGNFFQQLLTTNIISPSLFPLLNGASKNNFLSRRRRFARWNPKTIISKPSVTNKFSPPLTPLGGCTFVEVAKALTTNLSKLGLPLTGRVQKGSPCVRNQPLDVICQTKKINDSSSQERFSPCNDNWINVHDKLPYCYRMSESVTSKAQALKACKSMDNRSSLFQLETPHHDSVALHVNNKDPLSIWTDAALKNNTWYWSNGNKVDPINNELLEHGQTGGCLYLDTLDVAFWNNNINKPDNPYGLDEAYGKLVPTRCQDDLIKYGVLCQTPKNVKFV